MDMAAARPARDHALDALRGLAIFGMVLVNLQGDDKVAFPLLAHADWDGLTVADLVFPMFLLAAGLALPPAMDGRMPRASIGRIVRRSLLLWLIGFSIGFLVHASTHLADIRFTGVLERIGIVYLICALTCRETTGWRIPAIAAIGLMLLHGLLLYLPAPGELASSMAKGQGLSAWLDRAVLGGTRMYGKTFDPEGPLSTLGAIATAMIGVAVQRGVQQPVRQPNLFILATAALLAALALFASWLWPVNKALWTPTFVLLNAAIGLGLWGLFRLVWPRIGKWAPVRLAETLGQVALTLYVVHALLTALLVIPIGKERLWKVSFDALARLGLPLDWTSLLYAVIGGALSILITLALKRRGWVLRV